MMTLGILPTSPRSNTESKGGGQSRGVKSSSRRERSRSPGYSPEEHARTLVTTARRICRRSARQTLPIPPLPVPLRTRHWPTVCLRESPCHCAQWRGSIAPDVLRQRRPSDGSLRAGEFRVKAVSLHELGGSPNRRSARGPGKAECYPDRNGGKRPGSRRGSGRRDRGG